jgi:hypothetical protein
VGLDHKDADEQTFTEYCPHTFQALVFKQHPDPVVETASLSSLVPPKTTHKLRLCAKTITQGLLTSVQLETMNLACQQHELRLPSAERVLRSSWAVSSHLSILPSSPATRARMCPRAPRVGARVCEQRRGPAERRS